MIALWLAAGLLSGAGPGAVSGGMTATEAGRDSASVDGLVQSAALVSLTESGQDGASFGGTASVGAVVAAGEPARDVAAIDGDFVASSIAVAIEAGQDVGAWLGFVIVTSGTAAVEIGADIAAFFGTSGPVSAVAGQMAAVEYGGDIFAAGGIAEFSFVPITSGIGSFSGFAGHSSPFNSIRGGVVLNPSASGKTFRGA